MIHCKDSVAINCKDHVVFNCGKDAARKELFLIATVGVVSAYDFFFYLDGFILIVTTIS